MKCPDCDGRGEVFAFINRGEDISTHSQDWIPCLTCKGEGVAPDDIEARREAGHRWYESVRQPDELMFEVGLRLGLKPSEVSAIRQGRAPIPEGTP